jgi:phosphoserine phosphatase
MDWDLKIKDRLQKVIKSREVKKIAVFDADGTLWHGDLGESFFHHQIKMGLAPSIRSMPDPLSHYHELDLKSTSLASAWLGQINKGLRESELLAQTRDFYKNHFATKPTSVVKKLIHEMHENDFEVWVCTASPRYSVEPCLTELEIPPTRIIGVEVETGADGFLTDKPVQPIPYKVGKLLALKKHLSSQPLFVVGNSMGDISMLEWAKELSLGIFYLPHLERVATSEKALMIECQKRSWPMQIFNMC